MKKKKKITKNTKVLREEKVQKPHHIPIDVFIQEAKNLYQWAGEDQDALIAVGLAPGLIEDLLARCEALSRAEALWFVERNTRREAVKKCADVSARAFELKNRILGDFTFGFRNDPGPLKETRAIRKIQRKVVLISGLLRLHALGEEHPELLSGFGFDMGLLDQAFQTSAELQLTMAEASMSTIKSDELKSNRDQAYTHLKEAVDEIRSCGRFAFRGNKERTRGYSSNHIRQQNARNALSAKKPKKSSST